MEIPFTLEQLQILKAITSEGSFRKAAVSLFLSQPAVSLQIRNLEKHIDIVIFERNKKKVILTDGGILLLKYANRILALCEEAYRALKSLKTLQSGSLIIGASQTIGTYLMPRIIGLFKQRYPNVSIQLQVHSTRKICWAVSNGLVDIAIVGGEIPFELVSILKITPYAEDELALVMAPTHPFVLFKTIKKEDLYKLRFITLNNESTIRRVIEKTLNNSGIDVNRLKIEMELNSVEAIKNEVLSGLGVSFISISAIVKEVEFDLLHIAKVENILIKRVLSVIINPNKYQSKVSESFCDDVLKLFLSLSELQASE